MPTDCYPFPDQTTTETQYSHLFSMLQETGIRYTRTAADVPEVPKDLYVSLDTTQDPNGFTIAPGIAFIRGFVFEVSEEPVYMTYAPLAAGMSQRIDLVVLRLDLDAGQITPEIILGTGGNAKPTPTQEPDGIWEIPLANITQNQATRTTTDIRVFASGRVGLWLSDAQRPANPIMGTLGYNAAAMRHELYSAGGWQPLLPDDTSWVRCSLRSGYTGDAYVRRIGNIVYGLFNFGKAAGNGFPTDWQSCLTLPDKKFQPGAYTRLSLPGFPSSNAHGSILQCSGFSSDVQVARVGPSNANVYWYGPIWMTD